MTENTGNNVNAGVETNIGMEFQKHCTLYLFLEQYEILKDERYFIILEHHEDIIFGYLNHNGELNKIKTYQAKKSTNAWTLNGLLEIIQKITRTSKSILADTHPKASDFYQENTFVTNNTIGLKARTQGNNYIETINEQNSIVLYVNIVKEIQEKIKKGNKEISFTNDEILQLPFLQFRYIDLSRTTKSQLEHLYGKFGTVFGKSVRDHKAAVDTFLKFLRRVESTYNQNSIAWLLDPSKRLESTQINEMIDVLTSQNKAYAKWRQAKDEICNGLGVSVLHRKEFELHYLNSFERFKDLNEREHRRIYQFIEKNIHIGISFTSDIECIFALLTAFNQQTTTTFNSLQHKAVIAAAYFEIIEKI